MVLLKSLVGGEGTLLTSMGPEFFPVGPGLRQEGTTVLLISTPLCVIDLGISQCLEMAIFSHLSYCLCSLGQQVKGGAEDEGSDGKVNKDQKCISSESFDEYFMPKKSLRHKAFEN